MLPPSDSFLRQSRKLAQVLAGLQNRTEHPPPPYALSPEETQRNVDAEDEPAHPITIHIDASINIHGNGNTVIVQSKPSEQEQPQPESQPQTQSPQNPNPNPPPLPPASPSTYQKTRQTKLTELATSIITSLRDSEYLPRRRDCGRGSRPVNIRINAGVRVEGSRNLVCAGLSPGPAGHARRGSRGWRNSCENEDGNKRENGNGLSNGKERRTAAIRKRRAQSEPPDLPRVKRECREE